MGSGAKTPGRLKAGGQEEGSAAAAAARAAAKHEATVDIGALLRNKRSGLLGTSGGFGSLAGSRPAVPAGAAPAALAGSFGGGRGLEVITAENPIYSPDDSLARAASKLQNLKAPQARAPSRAAQAQAAIAAAAAAQPPVAAAAPQADASPEPAPERCESPQLIPAFTATAGGEQQAPAPAGEGSHKALSGEDSGELAALSALQKRRKSLGPATAAKQRFGEWFEGTDMELESTLQEYNREAPAPSPRMTRAQRRKSLAVDQSLHLEPGLARSLLDRSLAAEEEEREGGAGRGQAQQQQEAQQAAGQAQQQKRGAAGRRKSLAAMQQVQVALPAEQPAHHAHRASVADEVAALNAEMCAALSGLVGDESPEKGGHRGDQRPLREKLLESWDGKTYYERLLAMQEAEQAQQRADRQQAGGGARQQQRGSAGTHAGKAARTPGAKGAAAAKAPAAAAAPATQPAAGVQATAAGQPAAPSRATPSPLQVALAGSSAVAAAKAALMTPNSQRRKLNELTESLQLLKVSTRQSRAAAVIQAAHQQRGATPAPDDGEAAAAHPMEPPAAASRAVGSRSVSPEPPAPAASDRASAEPAAAPKTAGKRGGRRATSPPTEASAALAPAAPAAVLPQASAAPAGHASGSPAEAGVVRERLGAVLAEKESLGEQLRQVQAELAAEREARAAEQQELEQLRAKRKEEAAALKASEQRAKQLARELLEVQAAAAAHAKSAAEVEARWVEAEKALGAVLKAANGALKAAAAGKEEAKSLGEALRSCIGGTENATAAPAASSGRSRQSTGRQWR